MKKSLVFFLLLVGLFAHSQDSLDLSKIYLITCEPGDELYSAFGHSALRWKDDAQQIDVVFNYGTFNFRTPGFYTKFVRGKLLYQLSVAKYGDFLQEYFSEKRSVYEQELLMSEIEKTNLISFLKENAKPENSKYKYDFFFDNCSTRIRDVIEHSNKNNVKYNDAENGYTFRDYLHRYLTGKPWIKMGIDLIIGSRADKVADIHDQMFLPDRLMVAMTSAKVDENSLLKKPYEVLLFNEEKEARKISPFFTPTVAFGILLLLAFVLYKKAPSSYKIFKQFVYLLASIGSLVIAFLCFGTDHLATKVNYNLFWLSPLFFLLLFNVKKSMVSKIVLVSILLASTSYFGLMPQNMQFMAIYAFLSFLLLTDILEAHPA